MSGRVQEVHAMTGLVGFLEAPLSGVEWFAAGVMVTILVWILLPAPDEWDGKIDNNRKESHSTEN